MNRARENEEVTKIRVVDTYGSVSSSESEDAPKKQISLPTLNGEWARKWMEDQQKKKAQFAGMPPATTGISQQEHLPQCEFHEFCVCGL